jgi:hypothetical protein
MYNRLLPGCQGITKDFTQAFNEFMRVACAQPQFIRTGMTRCPCPLCKLLKFQNRETCHVHLLNKGFMTNYFTWTSHGEAYQTHESALPSTVFDHHETTNRYREMVYDAASPNVNDNFSAGPSNIEEEAPNPDTQQFYDLLQKAEELYCSKGVHIIQSCQPCHKCCI